MDYRIHAHLQFWIPKIHKAYKKGKWKRMSKDPEADSALEAFGYLHELIEKDGITVQILGVEEPDRVYFLIYDVHNVEAGKRTTPTGIPYGMDCFFNKATDRDAYVAHFPPPFTPDTFVSWLEDVFAESSVPFDFSKTRFE